MNLNITLEVSGMTCGSCVRHVTTALTELEGIAKVEVALREGLVHVAPASVLAPAQVHALTDDLIAALERAGYSAKPKTT